MPSGMPATGQIFRAFPHSHPLQPSGAKEQSLTSTSRAHSTQKSCHHSLMAHDDLHLEACRMNTNYASFCPGEETVSVSTSGILATWIPPVYVAHCFRDILT